MFGGYIRVLNQIKMAHEEANTYRATRVECQKSSLFVLVCDSIKVINFMFPLRLFSMFMRVISSM